MIKTQMVEFAGQSFILHPERALVWPAKRTLIVADLHFGKAAVFRERGVPVPSGTTANDLARLDALIATIEPRRLLILGDCLHGPLDSSDEMFGQVGAWRQRNPSLDVDLIRGNHDHRAGDPPASWKFNVHAESMDEDGILFTHAPCNLDDRAVICGHVHPSARLEDFDGAGVRVPCFVVEKNRIILPAFGRFTGTATIGRDEGRQLFVAAMGRVNPIP
jgi:DNA ligase-associated metallophosphoesterase